MSRKKDARLTWVDGLKYGSVLANLSNKRKSIFKRALSAIHGKASSTYIHVAYFERAGSEGSGET